MSTPLENALAQLDTTIVSINTKVDEQRSIVQNYKDKIIEKLRNIIEQLSKLKNNSAFSAIPQLKRQLEEAQKKLDAKTIELDETKKKLEASYIENNRLETALQGIRSQIEEKEEQIKKLMAENAQQITQLQTLQEEVNRLKEQENATKTELAELKLSMDNLVSRIGTINTRLEKEIQKISSITSGLTDPDDVDSQIQTIGTNIQAIMNMINNPSSGGTEKTFGTTDTTDTTYDIDTNLANFRKLYDNKDNGNFSRFLGKLDGKIQREVQNAITQINKGNETAIKEVLTKNKIIVPKPSPFLGGKRKHKTIKRRLRKTRKNLRGGYVYSASKELDNASSIVSASSGNKSMSLSKTLSKSSKSLSKTSSIKHKGKTKRKLIK